MIPLVADSVTVAPFGLLVDLAVMVLMTRQTANV
jgi:hypothetical protein